MTVPPTLDLNELATGNIPAITPALGAALAEAAGVCLQQQGHAQGVQLTVRGIGANNYTLTWKTASPQALRSWGDERETAEKGAEAVALSLAIPTTSFEVIRRARQGDGFDYWLGTPTAAEFTPQAGLEVSGIMKGTSGDIRARLREKLQQAGRSGTQEWETFAIVVEFSRPLAEVQKNDL